jgi:hypothetical protein
MVWQISEIAPVVSGLMLAIKTIQHGLISIIVLT